MIGGSAAGKGALMAAVRTTVLAFGFAIAAGLVAAQTTTDPGDLAFWQSIQNSTNPAEYRAYLEAYPTGRFAGLARVRAGGAAAPARAPVPQPAGDDDQSEYSVTVTPPAGRIGQMFQFGCVNIPTESGYDQLVVVAAGTPVMDPTRNRDQTRVLWYTYTNQCPNNPKAGPFAPGSYEVRWMSTLFNNDSPKRYEMKAKTVFTVR